MSEIGKQTVTPIVKRKDRLFKTVSSPGSSGGKVQITDIVNDGGLLKVSTDNGDTFVDVTVKEAQTAPGGYVKPVTGIPKADLAQDVQTSLNKADTALQTAPVTSVNGKTGVVQITEVDVAKKVTNKLTVTVNGVPVEYDGSTAKNVDITSGGADPEAVHFTPQILSEDQQSQARANIKAQSAGEFMTSEDVDNLFN